MKTEFPIGIKHGINRSVILLNASTTSDSGSVHADPSLNEFINITSNLIADANHTSVVRLGRFNDCYHTSFDAVHPGHQVM